MKKKIAMLIMVDGMMWEEQYLEYSRESLDDWTENEDLNLTEAQWFFY